MLTVVIHNVEVDTSLGQKLLNDTNMIVVCLNIIEMCNSWL